jgi:hypothetical protein
MTGEKLPTFRKINMPMSSGPGSPRSALESEDEGYTVDPRVTTGLTYEKLGLRPKLILSFDLQPKS